MRTASQAAAPQNRKPKLSGPISRPMQPPPPPPSIRKCPDYADGNCASGCWCVCDGSSIRNRSFETPRVTFRIPKLSSDTSLPFAAGSSSLPIDCAPHIISPLPSPPPPPRHTNPYQITPALSIRHIKPIHHFRNIKINLKPGPGRFLPDIPAEPIRRRVASTTVLLPCLDSNQDKNRTNGHQRPLEGSGRQPSQQESTLDTSPQSIRQVWKNFLLLHLWLHDCIPFLVCVSAVGKPPHVLFPLMTGAGYLTRTY